MTCNCSCDCTCHAVSWTPPQKQALPFSGSSTSRSDFAAPLSPQRASPIRPKENSFAVSEDRHFDSEYKRQYVKKECAPVSNSAPIGITQKSRPKVPFEGISTAKSDFPAHTPQYTPPAASLHRSNILPPSNDRSFDTESRNFAPIDSSYYRPSSMPSPQRAKPKIPFVATTENRENFKPISAPKQPPTVSRDKLNSSNISMSDPSVPPSFQSTTHSAFPAHSIELPSAYLSPPSVKKVSLPFEGSSTYKDTFKEYAVSPVKRSSVNKTQSNIGFINSEPVIFETLTRSTYKPLPPDEYRKALQSTPPPSKPRGPKLAFEGTSESREQFTPKRPDTNYSPIRSQSRSTINLNQGESSFETTASAFVSPPSDFYKQHEALMKKVENVKLTPKPKFDGSPVSRDFRRPNLDDLSVVAENRRRCKCAKEHARGSLKAEGRGEFKKSSSDYEDYSKYRCCNCVAYCHHTYKNSPRSSRK
ncbi:hypothetical protein RCL1_007179 [Eukaryota sp. TZLM3-RCL]